MEYIGKGSVRWVRCFPPSQASPGGLGADRPWKGGLDSLLSPEHVSLFQLMTLRGSVLEDAVPSTAKHSTARGLPLKEVLEHVIPELNVQCLRLAFNTPKVTEQLVKLDEQGVSGASREHPRARVSCRASRVQAFTFLFGQGRLMSFIVLSQLLIFLFLGFLNSEHFPSDEILSVRIDRYAT